MLIGQTCRGCRIRYRVKVMLGFDVYCMMGSGVQWDWIAVSWVKVLIRNLKPFKSFTRKKEFKNQTCVL
jgi:hypothetical protein